MKRVGERVRVVKNDPVFIQLFGESSDRTAVLTEIENVLLLSGSKTIVSRPTTKTEALNSAKNSHVWGFFLSWEYKMYFLRTRHLSKNPDLTAVLTLLKQKC